MTFHRSSAAIAALSVLFAAGSLADQPPASPSEGKLPTLRLADVSLDVLVSGGGSSASAHELETLQGGGHDPKRNGFTLQAAELSLSGAIDPYFTGEAHILFSEEGVELEEAYLKSGALGDGLELKAGYFLTEFGRVNPTHPHAWSFIDQPVVATRLLGGEGLRNAGFRISGLLPTPWYSELLVGAQNADGEFAASFRGGAVAHDHGEEGHDHAAEEEHAEEEDHEHEHADEDHEGEHEEEHAHVELPEGVEGGVGGRPIVELETDGADDLLYLARWVNSGDLSGDTSVQLGLSSLFGPNHTGEGGSTVLTGADLTIAWTPADNFRGWPFLKIETEVMHRDFKADEAELDHGDGDVDTLPGATLTDWGFYTQAVYGFAYRWSAGLRFEQATGSGDSLEGRDSDPYRNDRTRISPLLVFQPTEFSRIRVQYNYDDTETLEDGDAHTLWVSLEGLFGKHPSHKF